MSKCAWCGSEYPGLNFSRFCCKRCSNEYKESKANTSGAKKFINNVVIGIIIIIVLAYICNNQNKPNTNNNQSNTQQNSK